MTMRRLRCPLRHTVARKVGAKCMDNPCPQCGQPMTYTPYPGGRRLHPDGERHPFKVRITIPVALHFLGVSRETRKPMGRILGDIIEAAGYAAIGAKK